MTLMVPDTEERKKRQTESESSLIGRKRQKRLPKHLQDFKLYKLE